MAFSPWQILSPVQWAKWTWSAVRGGGAGDGEAGGPEGDAEEEDSQAETKSLSFRQVHASCRDANVLPSILPSCHPSIRPPARGLFCVLVCGRPPAYPYSRPRCVPACSQVPAVRSEVQGVLSSRVFALSPFSLSFLSLTRNPQSLRTLVGLSHPP